MIDVSAKIQQARQFYEAGKAEQARALLARALQQTPGHPDLSNAMSLVLLGLGQFDLAVYHAERAAQGRADDAGVLTNLGNALAQKGDNARAIAAYRRALAAGPDPGGTRLGLSHALRMECRFTEAADELKTALARTPDDADLTAALAFLLLKMARVEEAAATARRGLERWPTDQGCAGALAHGLNYMPGASGPEVLAAHQACGAELARQHPVLWNAYPNSRDPERRLRIGLLSYDLSRHAVAYFIEPFLRHRDRASLEVVCYFTGPREDEVSVRLKGLADGWKHFKSTPHRRVAETIGADAVDVLIELAGFASNNSLPVLAMRPAPVQVNYLGYPSTTGLPGIGHRIVDSTTDPAGYDSHCSERLTRIDPSFLCYQTPADAPPPRPASSSPSGSVTFGSFNSAPKINRGVIATWARLLREVPGSRLLLKAFEFNDPALAPDMLARFEAEGITRDRIEIVQLLGRYSDHLALYHRVDIALDPFPYNGTTTTFEALQMGVPVVTIRGDRHVSRVSSMILGNIGAPELVATDTEEYLRIARDLAADSGRRSSFHATLRDRLTASPLCDGPAYARRMTSAIREMWRRWCGGGS